jgi:small subunit ribosomal protein S17
MKKLRIGQVVSNKMDKTAVVAVASVKSHPRYGKTIRRQTKLRAHDENNSCQVGDVVKIGETRPLSKTKRWRVVEIMSREEVAEVQPSEIGQDLTVTSEEK